MDAFSLETAYGGSAGPQSLIVLLESASHTILS